MFFKCGERLGTTTVEKESHVSGALIKLEAKELHFDILVRENPKILKLVGH